MRVEDIRPTATDDGKWSAINRDIEWLSERSGTFETVNCPACDAGEHVVLYTKYGMRQVRCRNCETQYVTPRPSEQMLIEFYQNSSNYSYWADVIYPESGAFRSANLFRPRAELAADTVRERGMSGGALLEVGAGYGLFCEEARATGAFGGIYGIEPTPKLANICRGRDIVVFESGYEHVELPEPPALIASFETIEHLHSPRKFIDWCFTQLKPGGTLMLTCPNIKGFETMVLGEASETVDHQHINLFHPASLALLLRTAGFVDVEIETPGRLDVQLVKRALDDGRIGREDLDAFVAWLVADADDEACGDFQRFAADNRLSSHMRTLAFRPQ